MSVVRMAQPYGQLPQCHPRGPKMTSRNSGRPAGHPRGPWSRGFLSPAPSEGRDNRVVHTGPDDRFKGARMIFSERNLLTGAGVGEGGVGHGEVGRVGVCHVPLDGPRAARFGVDRLGTRAGLSCPRRCNRLPRRPPRPHAGGVTGPSSLTFRAPPPCRSRHAGAAAAPRPSVAVPRPRRPSGAGRGTPAWRHA